MAESINDDYTPMQTVAAVCSHDDVFDFALLDFTTQNINWFNMLSSHITELESRKDFKVLIRSLDKLATLELITRSEYKLLVDQLIIRITDQELILYAASRAQDPKTVNACLLERALEATTKLWLLMVRDISRLKKLIEQRKEPATDKPRPTVTRAIELSLEDLLLSTKLTNVMIMENMNCLRLIMKHAYVTSAERINMIFVCPDQAKRLAF